MTILPLPTLSCHPATPAGVVHSITVSMDVADDGSLALHYCLRGDIERLRIPERMAAASVDLRTDLLWQHTCFEAFIRVAGESAYREFNFSPSGQWASYAFSDYRQRIDDPSCIDVPLISSHHTPGRLELVATLPATCLPPNATNTDWQLGLSAVVETRDTVDGSHSYWALAHAGQQPDFHHADTFVLQIAHR